MFIRCTRTRSRSSGEPYVTYCCGAAWLGADRTKDSIDAGMPV